MLPNGSYVKLVAGDWFDAAFTSAMVDPLASDQRHRRGLNGDMYQSWPDTGKLFLDALVAHNWQTRRRLSGESANVRIV